MEVFDKVKISTGTDGAAESVEELSESATDTLSAAQIEMEIELDEPSADENIVNDSEE
jgi:hypothetical protein